MSKIVEFLENERKNMALQYIDGRLLDIGCGNNRLVKEYGNGIGIDIYPWKGVDLLFDGEHLPFGESEFDTITIVASLNHIIKREKILEEAKRVLKDNGRILVTMINPIIGFLCHKIIWWDYDTHDRGLKKEEKYGMTKKEIIGLLESAGFRLIKWKTFLFGLNNLYIASKTSKTI